MFDGTVDTEGQDVVSVRKILNISNNSFPALACSARFAHPFRPSDLPIPISTFPPTWPGDPAQEPGRHVDQRSSWRARRAEVVFELTGMEANILVGRIDVALPVDDHLGATPVISDG